MATQTDYRVARLRPGSFLAGLAVFCFFGVLAYWAFFQERPSETYDGTREKTRVDKLEALHKADHEKLTTYGWVDQKKGVAQIPIERGMELALAELEAKPVQASAVKLEHPYPAGLQSLVVAALGVPAPPAASGTAATSAAAAVSGTAAASGMAAPGAKVAMPVVAATTGTATMSGASPAPAATAKPKEAVPPRATAVRTASPAPTAAKPVKKKALFFNFP